MKPKDLIVTIVFILFLIFPTMFYCIVKNKMDNKNYENRQLFTKPNFSISNLKDYISNYESYYNDHLPFKNEIRKIRSTLLYNLFNTSANDKVLVGKDGWLFYNSYLAEPETNTIKDYQKITFFTEKEKESIKNIQQLTKDKLKDKNVLYYVFVLPNKENVYEDYIPTLVKRNKQKESSKTEELIQYLNKNSDIDIIYPKEVLVKNRKNYETYFKYDTHWNSYGAYLGSMELVKNIEDTVFEIPIRIEKINVNGDLAIMNMLQDNLKSEEPNVCFLNDTNYTCDNVDNITSCRSDNAFYNKTILIFGDSFRNALLPYIAKLYENSIFLDRKLFSEELIERYTPDIIVNEMVERYSEALKIQY